jgi:hypothetical protein
MVNPRLRGNANFGIERRGAGGAPPGPPAALAASESRTGATAQPKEQETPFCGTGRISARTGRFCARNRDVCAPVSLTRSSGAAGSGKAPSAVRRGGSPKRARDGPGAGGAARRRVGSADGA